MTKEEKKGGIRVLLLLMTILTFGKGSVAQGADSTATWLKRRVIYGTFGGKENFGSLNYEHVFANKKSLNWSVSIGMQPFRLSRQFSLPVSINAFTKGRLHHLEVDFTATFFMDKYHPGNPVVQEDFNKQIYLTPFVCYRLQGSRGLVLKTGIGPQLLIDPPSKNVLAVKTTVLQPSVFGAIGISF